MPYRPLAGAFEKVRRANECIKALDDEIGRLQDLKPYDLVPKTDMTCVEGIEIPRTQAQSLGVTAYWPDPPPSNPNNIFTPLIHAEVMGIYLVVKRPLPLLAYGSLIGDIVNNLRSALDQLTWELSIHYQRSLPTPLAPLPSSETLPRKSKWRSVQFPVAEIPSVWTGQQNSCLWLIDQNLISKIQDEQPYKCGKRYQRHWLWLLNELWNRDKHRSVAITVMYGGTTSEIGLRPAQGETMSLAQFGQEFDMKLRRVKSVGRFVNGVKLAEVIIARKSPRLPELHLNLDVNTTLRMGIQFKQAAPTYGAGVLNTLESLSANVERVLNGFVEDFK